MTKVNLWYKVLVYEYFPEIKEVKRSDVLVVAMFFFYVGEVLMRFLFLKMIALPKKTWFKMIAVPKKTWCPSNFVFAELQNFSDLYFVTASKGSIRLTKFCCKFFKVAINSGPTNKSINKTFGEHPIFVTHPVRFKITYCFCY